jgi:hypothetical protein
MIPPSWKCQIYDLLVDHKDGLTSYKHWNHVFESSWGMSVYVHFYLPQINLPVTVVLPILNFETLWPASFHENEI